MGAHWGAEPANLTSHTRLAIIYEKTDHTSWCLSSHSRKLETDGSYYTGLLGGSTGLMGEECSEQEPTHRSAAYTGYYPRERIHSAHQIPSVPGAPHEGLGQSESEVATGVWNSFSP